jgi:hypothetical protein
MKLVQVLRQGGKVDGVLAVLSCLIELDVVTILFVTPVGSATDWPEALRTGTKQSRDSPLWWVRCGRIRPPEGQPVSP